MADLNLQETAARLDTKIGALAADMKTGFENAFEQTQGGFDAWRDFAMFLDERVRKDMSERFNHVERRLDKIDERFDRADKRFDDIDLRFDAIDGRFNRMDQRFDGMEDRFDRLEQLIKGQTPPPQI
jgi:hypothetical protein